jgi:hypothetical protein
MSSERRRLSGLPLYLIGVLALVVAMGGAATAGAMITGKQIKDNTVTSADVKNGSLLAKDFKSSELAKLKGKNGTNGTNGAAGASAFDPPPSGTVIKGGGILSVSVNGASVSIRSYAPLPFTVAQPLTDTGTTGRTLWFGGAQAALDPNEIDTTACPGSAGSPTAMPGKLCVYVNETTNIGSQSAALVAGVTGSSDPSEQNGFYVVADSAAAGAMQIRYVWVYTAP